MTDSGFWKKYGSLPNPSRVWAHVFGLISSISLSNSNIDRMHFKD